jgi:Uma2 family endonuclease
MLTPLVAQPLPVPEDVRVARLTVEQYHSMIEAGVLESGDPLELLDGLLVPKMTKKTPHITSGKLVSQELLRLLPEGFHLQNQDPITTSDSEPEPDVAIVRGQPRDYASRKPGPTDVPLVVEIADDSLERDRGTKLRLYARASIAEYWIVNLREQVVEVYREPSREHYGSRSNHSRGSRVPVTLDGRVVGEVLVDALLP